MPSDNVTDSYKDCVAGCLEALSAWREDIVNPQETRLRLGEQVAGRPCCVPQKCGF